MLRLLVHFEPSAHHHLPRERLLVLQHLEVSVFTGGANANCVRITLPVLVLVLSIDREVALGASTSEDDRARRVFAQLVFCVGVVRWSLILVHHLVPSEVDSAKR